MASEIGQSRKGLWAGVVAALILGVLGSIALWQNLIDHPKFNQNINNGQVSYGAIEPFVKEYLVSNDIVNADGAVVVPDSQGSSDGVAKISVERAIQQLVDEGQLEYLKGDPGDTGVRGATGAAGPAGPAGPTGSGGGSDVSVSPNSGLTLSGGVISLKPCSVSQVLMWDGSTWECTTVSAGGIDGIDNDTTNASMQLTQTGTTLTAEITDSTGRTVSSNTIELSGPLATKAELASYATNAALGQLTSRVTALENAGYATQTWVGNQNYLTTTSLSNYLTTNQYITRPAMNTTLASYLLKSEFPATLNQNLKAGAGITISPDNTISSTADMHIFVNTSNHLAETAPDPNKIYLDSGTNPMSEWIYLNGRNGSTTDPSLSTSWLKIGDLNVDMTQYSTTTQMNNAINTTIANQLSDLAANSNLNSILADFVKTADMQSAIATATTDMATKTWVNGQGYLTSAALSTYATQDWVNSQGYLTTSALANYYTKTQTDSLLNQKASQSALDYLGLRVDGLTNDLDGKQNKLIAGQNITITPGTSGDVIAATIDLSAYATQAWVGGQGYIKTSDLAPYATTASMNTALGAKQDKLPTCADGQVVKYNTASSLWQCAADDNTHVDLTGYATQTWVADQNYLTSSALTNYVTNTGMSNALSAYVLTSAFANDLHQNLKAGTGIAIDANNTISSTYDTNIFVTTSNHLAEAAPNPNKIYIDTGTSPATQWKYNSGTPSDPASWTQIGEVSIDMSQYATVNEVNTALAGTQAKLPNCAAGQVVKFDTTNGWVCANDNDTTYDLSNNATKDWVTQQNYITATALAPYVTTTAMNTSLSNKQDKLPTCTTGQVVKYSTTAPNWTCANDDNTTYDLSTYATQSWVTGQGYLTTANAASTYVSHSELASALANYQPVITGAATTITNTNLTINSILQSDGNGKVAASTVTVAQLQTALSNIATLQTQQAANTAAIANVQNNTNNLGSYGEIATGQTFRGKPVYRNDLYLAVNSSAGQVSDLQLIGGGIVDQILNVGGSWMIGFGTETWQIGADTDGQNYGYVMKRDGDGALVFRSRANNSRSGSSNGNAYIIVEYTKK